MNRILVIRGGAIGDFVLTLPALKALRDAYPNAVVEILGYKHIAALAEQRFYAHAVRSIEYGALSSFFAKNADLDQELRQYFRSFDVVISYLFDPDRIFEANLQRSGVTRLVIGPSKIRSGSHAARQLAAPIENLGIAVNDYDPKVFPSQAEQAFARDFLDGLPNNVIALHPGSGSTGKNWPLANWIALGNNLLGQNHSLLIVAGEADQSQLEVLKTEWQRADVRFAHNLALPNLAAVLAGTLFIGHDSGISHLAAAAGAKCLLIFGPSDPDVWAPPRDNVRVIRASSGNLNELPLKPVLDAFAKWP